MIAVSDAWLRMLRKLAFERKMPGALIEKNTSIAKRPMIVP